MFASLETKCYGLPLLGGVEKLCDGIAAVCTDAARLVHGPGNVANRVFSQQLPYTDKLFDAPATPGMRFLQMSAEAHATRGYGSAALR